jgi:dienelactone hydrolase
VAAASEASSAAVRAAIDWARLQPWAHRDRLLLVGQSVGGLATVVTASQAPPGVVGFVNFSGGTAGFPDKRPGASCAEAALTDLFRRAGSRVRVPNLWLYAENDRYWGSEAPRAWHAAFASGGGATRLVMTPPVPNEDGHRLMLRGGRMWSVHVDAFVAGLGF